MCIMHLLFFLNPTYSFYLLPQQIESSHNGNTSHPPTTSLSSLKVTKFLSSLLAWDRGWVLVGKVCRCPKYMFRNNYFKIPVPEAIQLFFKMVVPKATNALSNRLSRKWFCFRKKVFWKMVF